MRPHRSESDEEAQATPANKRPPEAEVNDIKTTKLAKTAYIKEKFVITLYFKLT